MKKILVPTDFSECARTAEHIGLEIAKKANAEIHYLHLLMTPVNWVKLTLEKENLYPETQAEIGHARAELNELVKHAEELGLVAKHFLVFDKGRAEIDQHIRNHQHDFIVMGSHGASGFKEIAGSNTQRVVRNSPVPVLVVKKKPKKFEVENLVFASTFQEDVQKPFLKIIEFADLMKAQIHLVNINMPFHFMESDEAESNMQAFLKKCPRGTCSTNIYNALNEERGILKFSEIIKADVIALTTHGKTGFMKMIAPSIIESLVNHSDTPVLSVNIKIRS
jgi:nucleotide-binding universal stress UspA family protein